MDRSFSRDQANRPAASLMTGLILYCKRAGGGLLTSIKYARTDWNTTKSRPGETIDDRHSTASWRPRSAKRILNRDAIIAERIELEGLLQDDRLNDYDRLALHGAQRALQHIIEPDIWRSASQSFRRMDSWTIARVKRDRC